MEGVLGQRLTTGNFMPWQIKTSSLSALKRYFEKFKGWFFKILETKYCQPRK
jgi:undecaprenyl pyrophosphate synthase